METIETASCLSTLSWNTEMSRTRVTTVEGLSISAAPSIPVQNLDDVLRIVQRLGLHQCKFDEIEQGIRVGEGESFRVERCRYDNKVVAVKHLKLASPVADSRNSYRRLRTVLTELLIMHHVPLRDHPNVLSIIGYGWKTYRQTLLPYIVVEYCEHGSLRTWLSDSTKAITTKLILAGDVAAGLTALHLCDIVHGDLKLDNVVVLPSWDRPANAIGKLCDFGHSIILGGDVKQRTYYGTLLYNAPEVQLQEVFGIEPTLLYKCDIWAYGLLVWEIFADGKLYFSRDWEIDEMLSAQVPFCEDPDSKLGHLLTKRSNPSSSSSRAATRHPEIRNVAPRAKLESKKEGGESTVSKANFGTFDQKHLRALGKAFICRLPFPSCTIEKGYILKLLDRTLEVSPSVRLSRITPVPIMTKWNRSNLSSLKEKLAIHTGSSSFSFKMFRVDEEREIPWEHQRQILLDFERIATYHRFQEDAAAAAIQVAICYIVGFGTSPNNDSAIQYLRRAEEQGHPMAILFGRGLQNVLSGIGAEIVVPYDRSVVLGFKEQTVLKSRVFELHTSILPGVIQRFNTYGDFQTWLCGLQGLCLPSLTSSWVTTIPPSSKMNLCECFIAMEDVTNIKRLAECLPLFQETVSGEPLLIQACRKGNISIVQLFLDAGMNAEECTEDGLTIYHFLFMLGDGAIEIGRRLSKLPFTSGKILYDYPCTRKYLLHPQWPLELEGSPLAFAVVAASKAGVETLLEMGADPTAPIYEPSKADVFCSGWTPIHLAIKYHSSDILELLLAAARKRQQRVTAFHPSQAAWGGLKIEARNGLDNGKTRSDFPCPQEFWGDLACSAAYSTTLERYAMHGQNHHQRLFDTINALPLASLGQARRDGRVPIMQAIDFSDTDVVKTLLQLNPALSSKRVYDPKNQFTYDVPITFASQIAARQDSVRALNIVKKLGEFQSAFVMRDSQGRSALHLAVTGTSSTVAEWLLDHGGSVHDLDQDGRTPLHYCGSAPNVHLTLDAKAQINRTDKKGITAIQLAALAGQEDIVRTLIERGADLRIGHYEFGTPLHCAVLKRSRSVVLLLLEHAGANKDASILD
ncbi:hypothetical protein BGZ60DRAFT_570650, partial [Tricladium varicosporioides]